MLKKQWLILHELVIQKIKITMTTQNNNVIALKMNIGVFLNNHL